MHTRRRFRPLWAGLLAAFLVAALLPLPAQAEQDNLTDSFDTLAAHWHQTAGIWDAVDGAAVVSPPAAERGFALALRGWRLDGDGSVAATLSIEGQGAASSWAGIHLHRDGLVDDYAASGYTALLRRNGELAIIKARGDGSSVDYLGRANTSARPDAGPVEMTFSVSGDTLTATAAGTSVVVTDTTYRSGGISLVSHRESLLVVDEMAAHGLVVVNDPVPVPADCVVPSDDPVDPARGPVFNSDARIDAIIARIAAGQEPQAGAFTLLEQELAADLARTPKAPATYFVPFFYNDPDAHRSARDGLQNDANAAYRLALAYRLTGNATYGAKAATFLDDWSNVACIRTSGDSALTFSYHFPAMVFAAELLRDSDVWPAASEERFAAMLKHQAQPVAQSIMNRSNNWGSWGVAATMAISAYLADNVALDAAIARTQHLISHQTSPEGYVTEEVTRNNGVGDYGIWYTHFSLFPNLLAAEIASNQGEELFTVTNPSGVTMGDAVEVVAGWVADLDSFPFYTGDDTSKIVNVRTIDYLRADGIIAHSISYFELAANHYDIATVDQLITDEGPMTTIHAAPHLTLTHGSLPEPDGDIEPTEPPEPTPTVTVTVTAEPEPEPAPTVTETVTAEPTATPTVTVTAEPEPAPTVTTTATVTAEPEPAVTVTTTATATVTSEPEPAVTVTETATPAPGQDLYETPGFHEVNGRRWMTVCEPYSVTTRCFTYIWGTQVHQSGDNFTQVNGWVFNNLTYTASDRDAWADNPLGNTGRWTAEDGRQWRTECDTAATGSNGCRSYAEATVIERDGDSYRTVTKEVFNNMVRFS